MALDIKNLTVRTISGLIYVGLLIGSFILGPLAATILFSIFAICASYEIGKNTVGKENPDNWYVSWFVDGTSLVLLLFAAYSLLYSSLLSSALFAISVFLRFFVQLFLNQNKALLSISVYTFQLLYIGLPLALLIWVLNAVPDRWIVVCAVAMIWINDTGAYLVGCTLGRNKLFPRLSPNKSWEGFIGGVLFNIGASFIYYYCFHLNQGIIFSNVQGWIFIGICVSVFATLGDLFESLLKRSLQIKDFGKIIPGHGGILDRIDSLLCVVPCVLLAVYLGYLMFGV